MERATYGEFERARRTGITCPLCGEAPYIGVQWECGPDGCGHPFDTFETRGKCPKCKAQFSATECLNCGRWSPHHAWYRAR